MEGFSAVLVNNTIIYLFHLQILRTVTCVFIVKGIVKKKNLKIQTLLEILNVFGDKDRLSRKRSKKTL